MSLETLRQELAKTTHARDRVELFFDKLQSLLHNAANNGDWQMVRDLAMQMAAQRAEVALLVEHGPKAQELMDKRDEQLVRREALAPLPAALAPAPPAGAPAPTRSVERETTVQGAGGSAHDREIAERQATAAQTDVQRRQAASPASQSAPEPAPTKKEPAPHR